LGDFKSLIQNPKFYIEAIIHTPLIYLIFPDFGSDVFSQKASNRYVWNALISNAESVSYSVSITDTGTVARIPASYPARTFYQSFVANGARDCGPVANIRF